MKSFSISWAACYLYASAIEVDTRVAFIPHHNPLKGISEEAVCVLWAQPSLSGVEERL